MYTTRPIVYLGVIAAIVLWLYVPKGIVNPQASLVIGGVLFVAGFVLLLRTWIWFSMRFPMTAAFFFGLVWGLFGGRGRRW